MTGRVHQVQRGDTLSAIGRRYGVDWRLVAAANGVERPEHLRVGQWLVIPETPSGPAGLVPLNEGDRSRSRPAPVVKGYAGASASGALVYDLRQVAASTALSAHFRLIEFACRDGSPVVRVHPLLVEGLEALREALGVPLHVTSGYRTASHNAKVSTATKSYHLYGMAADVVARGKTVAQVGAAAALLGFGGLGVYDSWVHVDIGPAGRRWS